MHGDLYPRWNDAPLVDSHCHLYPTLRYDTTLADRLLSYPLRLIVDVGIHPSDWNIRQKLFAHIPGIHFSIGLHPSRYEKADRTEIYTNLIRHAATACAIGETGLDWKLMTAPTNVQLYFLEMHLSIAQELRKPIIVHARASDSAKENKAVDDIIERMRSIAYTAGGVMHCFDGNYRQAAQCLDLGLYISFAAPVSYTTAHDLREVVPKIPHDRILVESDSPYLLHKNAHKFQHRARKKKKIERHNHPAYLPLLYETIGSLRKSSPETIAHLVFKNLRRMLSLSN